MDNQIAKLVKEVAENKRLIKELSDDNKQISELLHGIYQISVDVNKKQDEWLNIGLKKPKKPSKSTETEKETEKEGEKEGEKEKGKEKEEEEGKPKVKKPAPRINIMEYFKSKCKEDIHYFDDIIGDEKIKKTFEKNKEKLEGLEKEKLLIEKANILYKALSKKQREIINEKKNEENKDCVENEIEHISED